MKPTAPFRGVSVSLPRHPAVAYLYLVRCHCGMRYNNGDAGELEPDLLEADCELHGEQVIVNLGSGRLVLETVLQF